MAGLEQCEDPDNSADSAEFHLTNLNVREALSRISGRVAAEEIVRLIILQVNRMFGTNAVFGGGTREYYR